MTTYSSGLKKVQEITLLRNKYSMAIASQQEKTDTVPHGLGLTPFIDYSISFDNGSNIEPPANSNFVSSLYYLQAHCDNNNIYFTYTYGTTPPVAVNDTFIIYYRLFTIGVAG